MFEDGKSEANFNRSFDMFKQRHRMADRLHNYRCTFRLDGLAERKAFQLEDFSCNALAFYIIFTALGLTWPFSMWFESKVSRFVINYKKMLTF